MKDITLQELLEAGCHFGHKSERWHPRAEKFIYTKKDGIHIIDLAKTKDGLDQATAFIRELVSSGGELLFIATKRQAKGIVKEVAIQVGAPYMTERWIGGFLTNWDGIHKNIQKINRMQEEEANGAWKKFPKHEQMKMSRYLSRLKNFYGGVLSLNTPPQVLFIVDVKKELSAVREAERCGIPTVAIVDTNSDPTGISHVIPANDDAVGSVTIITKAIGAAYEEGKEIAKKQAIDAKAKEEKAKAQPEVKSPEVKEEKPVASEKKVERKPRAKKEETK